MFEMNSVLNSVSKRLFTVSLSKSTLEKASTKLPVTGFRVSPYAVFIKEQYQTNPPVKGTKVGEVSKLFAAKWNSLTEQEKKVYADKSRSIFDEKVSQFKQLSEEEQEKLIAASKQGKEEKSKRKMRKEKREYWQKTNHPDLPLNSYSLFVKDEFAKLKAAGQKVSPVSDVAKSLKEKWDVLSTPEKEKYVKRSEELRSTYQRELELWKQRQSESGSKDNRTE